MSASMMLRLRKGERYKEAKHFKPSMRESVPGYRLGTSFKTKKALAEALDSRGGCRPPQRSLGAARDWRTRSTRARRG